MKKAIFLDRDGVINEDRGYVHKIKDFKFIPKVFEALKKLQGLGYKLFIITNQAGIGRGIYSEKDFIDLNNYMLEIFNKNGIKIEEVYYCPHHPDDGCDCRKPKTKFLKEASEKFNIDLSKSWVIGDQLLDIEMGKNAGCKTVLIDSKYVKELDTFKLNNLKEAVEYIQERNQNI